LARKTCPLHATAAGYFETQMESLHLHKPG
jgi:hypothetical protein